MQYSYSAVAKLLLRGMFVCLRRRPEMERSRNKIMSELRSPSIPPGDISSRGERRKMLHASKIMGRLGCSVRVVDPDLCHLSYMGACFFLRGRLRPLAFCTAISSIQVSFFSRLHLILPGPFCCQSTYFVGRNLLLFRNVGFWCGSASVACE